MNNDKITTIQGLTAFAEANPRLTFELRAGRGYAAPPRLSVSRAAYCECCACPLSACDHTRAEACACFGGV